MERRVWALIVFGAVVWIVASMGSFRFNTQDAKMNLAVNHPDECRLLLPKAKYANVESVGSSVRVTPGKHRFVFDCEGREIAMMKDVSRSETSWEIDPRDVAHGSPEGKTASWSTLADATELGSEQ